MKIIYFVFIVTLLFSFSNCSNKNNSKLNNKPREYKVFEGDFICLTGSSYFIDYASSSNYQIPAEGEYYNLEREFLSFNFEGPTKVYLKAEGYLEGREGREKNTTETFFIVTKIILFDTNRASSLL